MSNPIYTTRVSSAVAAEQAARATEEGMRELAAALAARRDNVMTVSDSESESEMDSDYSSDESVSHSKKRKRQKPLKCGTNTDKLEDRIRFLQLDLANAMVDVSEAKAGRDELVGQLAPYKKVNDEMTYFKSSMGRAFKDVGSFTKRQLESKFNLFMEEASEHMKLCALAIDRIALDEVKAGMNRVLVAERKRFVQMEKDYKWLIFWTGTKEFMMLVSYWMCVIVVVLAVGYKIIF
jgi:hypothetical protein